MSTTSSKSSKTQKFSFSGHVSKAKPAVPQTAYAQLRKGDLINGTLTSILPKVSRSGIKYLLCQVEVNDHVLNVPVFDTRVELLQQMKNTSVTVWYGGKNDNGYYDFRLNF